MPYNFADIESKWQAKWNNSHCFESHTDPAREKFFCLEMFPYPSGALHMGHIRNYSIGDVLARFLRKNGKNVLYTIGFDSFVCETLIVDSGKMVDISATVLSDQVLDDFSKRSCLVTADVPYIRIQSADIDRTKFCFEHAMSFTMFFLRADPSANRR